MSKDYVVYIAGPMRGLPRYNFEAFLQAAKDIRDSGLKVLCPAELDMKERDINPFAMPEDTDWAACPEGFTFETIIQADLDSIKAFGCNAMYMLEGWEKSTGAKREYEYAKEHGFRIEFQDGSPAIKEVIDVEVVCGALKNDDHKLRWDLLPLDVVEGAVAGFTHGAAKYAPNNWRKGARWGRLFAALQRHLQAFWRGEEIDEDSGLHHLDLAQCELMMLRGNVLNGIGEDDRWRS